MFDNIVTDEKPIAEAVKAPEIDDINAILSGYKNITKDETSSNTTQPTIQQTVQENNNLGSSSNNNGTPVNDVYKTGKKAGQPRKPRVTFNPTQQQATLSGEILTGALFITLVDLLLPLIIAGLNNRFSKQKIKSSDLYLTAKQKSELAPIADKVVKQFDFNANPIALLCVSMIGIYGANFALLKFGGSKDEKNTAEPVKKNT